MNKDIYQLQITGSESTFFQMNISLQQFANILGGLAAEGSPTAGSKSNSNTDKLPISATSIEATGLEESPTSVVDETEVDSPTAALRQSGAKTNPEKITAFGRFLEISGRPDFSIADIKNQFSASSMPIPRNLPRDIRTAVRTGLLVTTENNNFKVSAAAKNVFDADYSFPKTQPAHTSSAAPRRVNKQKPDIFMGIDVFPNEIPEFPDYSKMHISKDRILWAVYLAKTMNITNGLTVRELAWLTDELGAPVISKQISAAFTTARKQGFATRNTNDKRIMITSKGESYLRNDVVKPGND